MNPERGQRVHAIFEAALRCDPAGRAALLDAVCGDDPELRAEVVRLLADDERASRDRFLAAPTPPGQGDGGHRLALLGLRGLDIHILCPHCRSPIELLGLPADDVVCPSCGSTFRLERESTASWGLREGRRKLGRFELVEAVGVGAFGSVYKARDPQLDRTVAIKVPRAGSLATAEDRDRFLREARSVAQLRHARIVPVHEVGEHEGTPYLVSDFVRGVTLSDLLTSRRPTPREAAALVADIADTLQYAHEQGVIHRDVKPSNILLDDQGRPHLMDFGLAKREAGEVTMTFDGQVLGTPAYMSPEQAKGEGHKVDGRSDIYSLGVILYELLTGELPFRGNTRMLLHQVLHDEPRSPRSLNDRIPRDLETICIKAMAKEPSRRYATMRELAEDLRRFLNGEAIRARPVGSLERGWRWCKRNPVVAGLTATLVAVVSTASVLSVASVLAAAHFNRLAQSEADAGRKERIALIEARRANNEVLKALDEAHAQSAGLAVERGLALVEQRDADRGLLWLTRALTLDPKDVAGLHPAIRINLTRAAREQVSLPHAALRPRTAPPAPPFERQPDQINLVAYSPDGARAATGNYHGTIQLWDTATGQPIGEPFGPTGRKARLTALAFTPDGRGLLAGTTTREPRDPDSSGDAQVWDVATGRPRSQPVKVPGWVAAFSRDGRLLAAISNELDAKFQSTRVRFFEAATGRQVGSPLTHDRPVHDAIAFSPDGRTLLTGDSPPDQSGRSRARLWEVKTGRSLWASFPHPGWHIYGVAFSPDGKLVATAANDRYVRILDAADGKVVGTPMENNDQVNVVAFSPDGRTVAAGMATVTAGKKGPDEVRLWDRRTGKTLGPDLPHDGGILAVAFSPDGKTLLSSSTDGVARLWTLPDGPAVGRPVSSGGLYAVAFTPDGRVLLTGGFDNVVRQLDPATGRRAGPTLEAGKFIRAIAVHPNGRTAAIGVGLPISTNQGRPDYGEVQLWDRISGRRIGATLKHHTDRPDRLAFTPDGQALLTTDGKQVRLWDPTTGANLGRDFEASKSPITALALSPDGKLVLIGDPEGAFQIWDLAARRPKSDRVKAHRDVIVAAAFSADGTLCATGSWSKQARVWEVATGRPRGPLLKHNGFIESVAFSPVDPILATAGQDQNVRLWDLATGTPLGAPLQVDGQACRLAFSPEGRTLAVTCLSHTLVFEVPAPAQGKAEDLRLWVEAITGRTLDEQEGVAPVGLEAWESLRREQAERKSTPGSVARSSSWEVSHHLGSALAAERDGDTSAALWHLDGILADQPDDPMAWSLKASLLDEAGRKDEARAALARAIEVVEDRKQLAQFASKLGTLEAEAGRWSQASRDFEKSFESGEADPQSSYYLDLSLLAAGDRAGLRRANDRLLARFGAATDPELCNSVAWSCALAADAVADPEVPVRLAELAVKGAPEDMKPLILNTLGAALYRAGRFDEAIRRLEEGIRRRGGASEPQDWAFLALAHHRLGRREQALPWLERLRNFRPVQSPNQFWSALEIRLFKDEAEAVIVYDSTFPTEPFAR
jgi:WD40 repeat protein/tetratricopeptide (TPR) repeat protein/tRNA A-37 threonylcarbamoyl transferase component Bud32